MSRDLTPADPEPVLELLMGFRKSQVMFTACTLGIFDSLANGPKSIDVLAAELPADADALSRLLGACEMLGLLRSTPSGFANTPSAQTYLTAQSPSRLLGYVNYSGRVLWKLWDNLPDAIREGTHRWPQTYGWDGPIFKNFFRTPDAAREFLLGMHGYGLISSPVVVNALDLSKFRTFCDLGGATGHLVIAACRRWPEMQGIVFDLPDAVPLAREIVGASEVENRIEIVPGDFFADPLPQADLFALGRILHDWTEAKIRTLLGRIFDALPSGGGVLIAEKLLRDDRAGPDWAVLQSLNMLVCTEGKERTLGEYETLLTQAGFANVVGIRTAAPLDAVLAVKA